MTLTYQGCVAVINGWKDRSLQAVNVLTMSYQLDFIRQTVFRLHSAQGQYQHWTSLILLLTKQDATYVLCTGQKLYRCRPLANNVDYVDSWQVWTCPSMSLPQNCTFHWGDPSLPETWFLGPTRVHTLNGTSSTSVGLPVVSTDTQRTSENHDTQITAQFPQNVLARSCITATLLRITLTMLTADKSGHAQVYHAQQCRENIKKLQAHHWESRSDFILLCFCQLLLAGQPRSLAFVPQRFSLHIMKQFWKRRPVIQKQ